MPPIPLPGPRGSSPAIPGEVVVRFQPDLPRGRRDQLITGLGCRIVASDPASGYVLVRARDGRAEDLLAVLGQRGDVAHAEPSYRMYAFAQSFYDPYQWNLFPRGTASGRTVSNHGIQAAAAWEYTRGAGVTVAVLDTGVAYQDHEEFYRAPGLASTDFVAGYDFVNDDDFPNDDHGHGTHVAGILAGNLVDGGGALGVAPEVSVLPLKVLGADGSASTFTVAQGIRWAADQGAHVINISLGGEEGGQVLSDAVRYAAARDCVLVAAAGNDKDATEVAYPAYYSECIAVGATGFDGVRAPYSSRGRRLFIMAPGGNLSQDLNQDGRRDGIVAQTFDPGRGYDSFDYFYLREGTSMAAPQVAGAIALARAANPDLTALEIRLILQDTALPLGSPGRNIYYGYGLVDALAAVEAALAQR